MENTAAQAQGITFADPAEMTIADLEQGDFIVAIPTQMGIRGCRPNSGIKTISDPHWNIWKIGPPRRKHPVASRTITFMSEAVRVDYPSDCTVTVRQPIFPD